MPIVRRCAVVFARIKRITNLKRLCGAIRYRRACAAARCAAASQREQFSGILFGIVGAEGACAAVMVHLLPSYSPGASHRLTYAMQCPPI